MEEVLLPVQAAAGATKMVVGDKKYNEGRKKITYATAASMGFIPYNPTLWPVQIAMFVAFILIFALVFGVSVGESFLGAYLAQAIIVTFAAQWLMDKGLKYFVGV